MHILITASEAAPFLKSGGLGDVMEALPAALSETEDTEVTVFVPFYQAIKHNSRFSFERIGELWVPLAWRQAYAGIYRLASERKNLRILFIDNESYFLRPASYGYYDDGERFAYFSKAVLESLRVLDYYPDIIHCNDWQTALIPVFLRAHYGHLERYRAIHTMFTIHNIEYQGKVPPDFMRDVLGLDESWRGTMTYDGCVNFMKAAIETADCVTTVSETYAQEIRYAYFSHGLDPILRRNEGKLHGIVNGIGTERFDPAADPALPMRYSAENPSGKRLCKAALQREMGLPERPEVPIIGMVSRLVPHKGLDLIRRILEELLSWDIQIVLLGTGDAEYEQFFAEIARRHGDRMSAQIRFDNALAQRIYAGSDLFLMPSKSEPCGLSQLIAMRYGTVPIVRETGGLRDTVPPLNPETMEGRGFTFVSYNAHDMLDAIRRAVTFFYCEKEKWNAHVAALLRGDYGWDAAVQKYLSLYRMLCGR